MLAAYRQTLVQLRFTIVTVTAVLALAFVMNLSGQTQSLGMALASAGGFFVVALPRDRLDRRRDHRIGHLVERPVRPDAGHGRHQAGLNPLLMAATNSSAGVLGKMLSPQNLAVAAAADRPARQGRRRCSAS